jgi:pterin-4a-carbinolamine dehydratase
MKTLAKLHESFISSARKPMLSGGVPIRPVERDAVLVPATRWTTVKVNDVTMLKRTYMFMDVEQKRAFVCALMDEERAVEHTIELNVHDETVDVVLWTRGINSITNVDKELAMRIDELHIDMMYNGTHVKR